MDRDVCENKINQNFVIDPQTWDMRVVRCTYTLFMIILLRYLFIYLFYMFT